jgi:hypothetical protein
MIIIMIIMIIIIIIIMIIMFIDVEYHHKLNKYLNIHPYHINIIIIINTIIIMR